MSHIYQSLFGGLSHHLGGLQLRSRVADNGRSEHLRQVLSRHLAVGALGNSFQTQTQQEIKYKFHFNLLHDQRTQYNIHDIKYISDGSCLETPTVANGIEPTLVRSSTH